LRGAAGEFLRVKVWRLWRNYKFKLEVRDDMHERKLMLRFRLFREARDKANGEGAEGDF
jgi:hypothetical protein